MLIFCRVKFWSYSLPADLNVGASVWKSDPVRSGGRHAFQTALNQLTSGLAIAKNKIVDKFNSICPNGNLAEKCR